MSILDNILLLPDYGLKYRLEFTSRAGNVYDILIYQQDWISSLSEPGEPFVGTASLLTIQQSFADSDIFKPIAGTQINLGLITNPHTQYREFRRASNHEFYIEVIKKGVTDYIMSAGYLIPETFEQDHGAEFDVIHVSFLDGLGFLREHDFTNNDGSEITGMVRLSDMITFFLNKIGFRGHRWYDAIPISPQFCENQARGVLNNTYIDAQRLKGKNCGEILIELLESYNAQIVRYYDGFLIRNPDVPKVSYAVSYTAAGAVHTTGITVGGLGDHVLGETSYTSGRATLRIEPPLNKLEIRYVRELNQNLLAGRIPGSIGVTQYPPWQSTININNISLWPYYVNWNPASPDYGAPAASINFEREMALNSGWIKIKFTVEALTYKTDPIRQNVDIRYRISLPGLIFPIDKVHQIKGFGRKETVETVVFIHDSHTNIALRLYPGEPDQANDLWYVRYTNWEVIAVKDRDGTLYSDEEIYIIPINENNNRTLRVDKIYGHNSIALETRAGYIWVNNLFSIVGGEYTPIVNYQYIPFGNVVRLHDYVRNGLVNHHTINKLRMDVNIVSKQYTGQTRWIFPFTQFIANHLEQKFIVNSMEWDGKMDTYRLELIGYRTANWILETGIWDDTGIWMDEEKWIDTPD